MRKVLITLVLVGLLGSLAAEAKTTSAAVPIDKCSNLKGVQHVIPRGYRRGIGLKCVKKPKTVPKSVTVNVKTPPPPRINNAWWPSGYAGWTGTGDTFVNGQSLVAYQPSSCPTLGGGSVPNGQSDTIGDICWAYTMQVNVQFSNGTTGCKTLYVSANEISGGVIVGYTNYLATDVPNNQAVLVTRVVPPDGYPGLQLQLSEIDCYGT